MIKNFFTKENINSVIKVLAVIVIVILLTFNLFLSKIIFENFIKNQQTNAEKHLLMDKDISELQNKVDEIRLYYYFKERKDSAYVTMKTSGFSFFDEDFKPLSKKRP